jgi:hypothetical protein
MPSSCVSFRRIGSAHAEENRQHIWSNSVLAISPRRAGI